jgi:hypothetical protein
LKEVIDATWKNLGHMHDLGNINRGLDTVMKSLHNWGKRKFGNITRELSKLREKLANLQEASAPREEIRTVTDQMNEVLYREEMLWLQRSRIDWLREGDRNTKFFHHKAVWRARKNKIMKLCDDNGIVNTVPTDMQRMATSYFKFMYTRDPSIDHEGITDLVQHKVTQDMNELLCKDFSNEEISDALFQIGPIKAPGPAGFPARFYQRNWGLMKADIISAVKVFFATGGDK